MAGTKDKPKRRRAPRKVREMTERVEVDATVACSECGRKVRLKTKGVLFPFLRAIIERQARGEVPTMCGHCTARIEREEQAAAREQRRREDFEHRLGVSRIPRKWRAVTFADIDADPGRVEALTAAEAWGAGERRGLLLFGEVGRGKTMLAAAAAMARLHRSHVRWLNVADLLMTMSLPFDAPERTRAMRALEPEDRRVALVLDDLDKARPTEHAVAPLYVAINAWVEAEQPLLVTLNRSLDELAEHWPKTFAEPLASRLAEHCKVVEVGGRDRRLEP